MASKLKLSRSITKIEDSEYKSSGFLSVVLPKDLISVGESAFSYNEFKSLNLPPNVETIGDSAFYNNSIIDLEFNENLKIIGDYAFANNEIEIVNLPASIQKIGKFAFANNNISSVDLDGIEGLDDGIFSLNNLIRLNIPDSIKKIGDKAFLSNKIVNLQLPNTLEYIGKSAFQDNLIEELTISENISIIEEFSFENNRLKNIEIPSNIKIIKNSAFKNNDINNLILNDGIEIIEDFAFANNNLKKVILPKSIIKVEDHAFDAIDIYYDEIAITKDKILEHGLQNCIEQIKNGHLYIKSPNEKTIESNNITNIFEIKKDFPSNDTNLIANIEEVPKKEEKIEISIEDASDNYIDILSEEKVEENTITLNETNNNKEKGEINMSFENEISLNDLEANIALDENKVEEKVEPVEEPKEKYNGPVANEDMLITKTAFFEKLNELSFDEKLENLKYAAAGLSECKEEFDNIKTERDAIEARKAELDEKYNDLVEVESEIKKRYNELLMSLVIPDDKKNNLDGLLKDINYFIQQLDDEE